MTSPNPEGIIPSVILPNSRSSLNPLYSSSFQALDTNTVYVLGEDGNLWLEHGGNDEWGQVPPPRERVDGNVRAFQALDANNVYVLGSNGNLWLEHSVNGKFGQVPPPRDHVDGNVAAFQAMNSEQVYVLGTDGNLWLEHSVNGKFGQVPPPRDHVDGNVAAFVALPQDVNTIYVLGTDGNLWLEHSVNGKFGQVPPPRDHIDGNVIALQPIDYNTVYVLGEDGNLWLEHSVNGKFGQVPPPREHVDGNVMAFQAFSADTIFVLGKDGNLWSEYPVNGKFGAIPPPRTPGRRDTRGCRGSRCSGTTRRRVLLPAVPGAVHPPGRSLVRGAAGLAGHHPPGGELPAPLQERVPVPGPQTVMAPGPPKAIGKGLFTNGFIAMLLTERFTAGRSMNSLVTGLSRQGAEIPRPPGRDVRAGGQAAGPAVRRDRGTEPGLLAAARGRDDVAGVRRRRSYAAGCLDFQVLTLPPPNQPFNFIMFQLGTDGSLGWGYDDPRPVDGNVMLPVAYGTIRPAYVIMTLVYAPPGTTTTMSVQTNVQYANGSTTGTTTSASSSFKGAVDVKAQVGGMLDSASVDFSASKSETDSQSVEFTQGRSFTITVHGPSQDGINHDDDLFYLWLNPTLSVTVDPHKSVSWMISIDGQEMNIQPVTVGELKNPATMPANLKRELDAAGLTPSDYESILNMNPFAFGPAAIDPKRFAAQPQALSYVYNPAIVQTQGYTLSSSEIQKSTHTTENTYGVTASASAGMQGIFKVTATFSFQWTNSNTATVTEQTTNSASALIAQPSSSWNGSVEALVYWDTFYNSFMFAFPS